MSRLTARAATLAAIAAVAAFALGGWSLAAAPAAARSTARVAAVFFLLAFAAPGLGRFVSRLPSEAALIRAYLAAQAIHYCAVLSVLAFHVSAGTVRASSLAKMPLGLLPTIGLALTARVREPTRRQRVLQAAVLHVNFVIYAVVYLLHPNRPLRLAAIPLFAALALRYLPALFLSGQLPHRGEDPWPSRRSASSDWR
jgi:hypothetical protein